ncbi:MAG: MobC family plasmid mobilization relaxosome protein [Clostridiaceae bacterium]
MAKDAELELCLRLNKIEAQTLCTAAAPTYANSKPVKTCPTRELRDLYTEINRIGNNINQIARNTNVGIATAEDAAQALLLLKKVYPANPFSIIRT